MSDTRRPHVKPTRSRKVKRADKLSSSCLEVQDTTSKLSELHLNQSEKNLLKGEGKENEEKADPRSIDKEPSSEASKNASNPQVQTKSPVIAKLVSDLETFRENHSLSLLNMLSRSDETLLSTSVPSKQIKNFRDLPESQRTPTEWIAVDCEMVGVGLKGSRSALGRVSIVNKWGFPLLDVFVLPNQKVTQWRTKWSGLSLEVLEREHKMGNLVTFEEARKIVETMLAGRIVIGHSIKNDLRVLGLTECPPRIIDTQMFSAYSYFGLNNQPGLKNALNTILDIKIQNQAEGHDSVEDAQATMLLFRVLRPGFEKEMASWKHKEQPAKV